ncbi:MULTISPECIES: hypothetical protein [Niallia]|uniref:hypothetical protein n=1 Tax=Niallia TaxID=2837506 RepID=UPI00300A4A78
MQKRRHIGSLRLKGLEWIGMLIGGGIAVVLTAFLERHTKIMMTVCLLNFCYDNTVRSTIS